MGWSHGGGSIMLMPCRIKAQAQERARSCSLSIRQHSPQVDHARGGAHEALPSGEALQRRTVRELGVTHNQVGVPQPVDLPLGGRRGEGKA